MVLPKQKTLLFGLILCLSVFSLTSFAQTPEEERSVLENELKILEEKIAQYEKDVGSVQKEKQTLQSQITLIQNKIKKLDLQIKQGNLTINDLKSQIQETEGEIENTTVQLEKTKGKLKESLRALYLENKKSPLEILIAEDTLSDFFTDTINLESLNKKIADSLAKIRSLKSSLEEEKDSLGKEKDDLQKTVGVQILQKQASLDNRKQQELVLEQTKGKESLYQKYLEESKQRAAQIRTRIFELIGVAQAPNFGQAVEIAKLIFKTTSVRPAFLLAVIKQESNLGKNVGQCNCPKGPYCKNPDLSWKEVMKEDRDWKPFLEITKELDRDPNTTPVSCPMYLNGKRIGYGGAMGPAQFMPSTWVRYKSRIEEISGRKPADPWNIYDAFLAAALYLKDFGASSQKEINEWRAAMIYFSGSTNVKYRFYGDQVINLAKGFENDIKELENQLTKAGQ